MAENEVTFGTYYVRPGAEAEFEQVLPQSWATLRRLGFIADRAPQLFRAVAAANGTTRYVELTHWVDGVMGPAHEHPDVIPIWTRLTSLVEPHTPETAPRGLTFDEFVPVTLHG